MTHICCEQPLVTHHYSLGSSHGCSVLHTYTMATKRRSARIAAIISPVKCSSRKFIESILGLSLAINPSMIENDLIFDNIDWKQGKKSCEKLQ